MDEDDDMNGGGGSRLVSPLDSTMDHQRERYLPTPGDIEEATARIRRGWDADEFERRGTVGRVPWKLPGGDKNSEVLSEAE